MVTFGKADVAHARTQLCVIGCGITGVAALAEASALGIQAIGVDSAPAPLASIREHMYGTVYLSPARHYELPGLPLDCAVAGRCTREDVVSYFGRVLASSKADARFGVRCTGIEWNDGKIVVVCKAGTTSLRIRCERVLVTNWFKRRRVRIVDQRASASTPVILRELSSRTQYLGGSVVVVGGGLTGIDYAKALMACGSRVTVLLRSQPRPVHFDPTFLELLSATRSCVVPQISGLRVTDGRVEFTRRSRTHRVVCDAVIFATGAQLDAGWLRYLASIGVLDGRTASLIRAARSWDEIAREMPHLSVPEKEELAVASRPDLWRYLFDGVRGVHFAGTLMHVGAAGAGARMSIASGLLAARALGGCAAPPGFEPPLHRALLRLTTVDRALEECALSGLWRMLRPLHVQPGSLLRIADQGSAKQFEFGPRHQVELDPLQREIVRLADGRRTSLEIGTGIAAVTNGGADLFGALRTLWHSGVLTWLPPASAVVPEQQWEWNRDPVAIASSGPSIAEG